MNIQGLIQESKLPRLEAELLLAFLIQKPREFIIVHEKDILSLVIIKKFKAAEKKRLANWPLAYLTGHKEFYGLDFKVNKNVLVPRPETEILVEIILNYACQKKNDLDFIDIGTGSGAIIITLANELKKETEALFDAASFLGLDISKSALTVARQNAKIQNLHKKIAFLESNLLKNIPTESLKDAHLVIAANLPYLTPKQTREEPSISREPKLALDGGLDGLKYYRQLFKQLQKIKPASLFLICEINPEQARHIKLEAQKTWPRAKLKIIKDLSGQKRFITISLG
ncbi:MAG: peptide chain release factor N(5)-glutamine methyltransferase [Candidatus Falkowbacteria bacterium]|nr:MAG: peptide chain release factor N(5)-glutamine methyltransferase [Candidatus Falkowbacteria bacterium]